MRLEEARKFALSLPEVTEQPLCEKPSFRIQGKIFATLPLGGDHMHVFVGEIETRALVEEDPAAFEELWWGKKLSGVRVSLPASEREGVIQLLEEAWRRKAPITLIRDFDAGDGRGGKRGHA